VEVPLTAGGVPAIFLPENCPYDPLPGTPGHPRIADYIAEQPYDSKVENKFNFCRRELLWMGVRVAIREDLPQAFHTLQYDEQYVFLSMQMNVGKLSNGVCGSPIVHDDWEDESESDGDVPGIVSRSDQNIIENLFVNVMDQVVNDGWEVERGQ
jgi:hypothetical protein